MRHQDRTGIISRIIVQSGDAHFGEAPLEPVEAEEHASVDRVGVEIGKLSVQ